MNIQEIRRKYPQYDDLPDKELVDGLHSKFYSDIPVNDFYGRVGFNAAPVQQGPKVLPDTDTSSDFMRGIRNYPGQTESLLGSAQAVTGLAAKKLGFEDTGTSLIQKGLGKIEEGEGKTVSKKSDEFTEAWEKGIGTVLTDWLPYQVGAGAANIMESLAFAGLGAGVGAVTGFGAGAAPGAAAGVLSKTLVKQGIKEAAEDILKKETAKAIADGATKEAAKDAGKAAMQTFVEDQAKKVITTTAGKDAFAQGAEEYAKAGAKKLGSYAGSATQAGVHGVGEVGEQAIQAAKERGENIEDIDLGRVLPAATVHAIADFVNERIGLGALKIGDTASEYLITEIAKRIAITGFKQTGGEEIQTIAERYGAKLSLTDAEALKAYINTAAASFGMAVAPGAIGGARTHLAKQLELQPGGVQTEPETEAQKKAKAGAPAISDQQLEDFISGKTSTIPTKIVSAKGSPEELAAKYLTAYPEGKEGDIPTTGKNNLNINQLYAVLKSLGIEKPPVDKAAGETHRAKAMEALRDYMGKKNAGITKEELTDIPDLTGTPNGTQTTETVKTETQGQQTSTTADVTPPPVTPPAPTRPLIPMSVAMQDVYEEELAAFKANPNDLETLKGINSLEKKHGMPLTTAPQGRVLSAKKADESNLQELKDIRAPETSAYEYDPELSRQKNQQLANKIAKREEVRQVANKAQLTEMSDKVEPSKYDVSEEDKNLYLQQKKEHDTKAREANAKRNESLPALEKARQIANNLYREATKRANAAVAALDAYKKANKITEDIEPTDYATTKRVKKSDSKFVELTDTADKALEEQSDTHERLREVDNTLAQLGPEINDMPRWNDLSAADKDVYFSNISANPSADKRVGEHQKAARALIEHRASLPVGMDNAEQRVANAYTETRTLLGKEYKIKFPEWKNLSDHAKEIFREGLTNLSGLQLDRSFGNLAKYLNEQNKAISERQKILTGVEIQDRLDRVARQTEIDTAEREDATKGWRPTIDAGTGEVIPARFGSGEERVSKNTLDDYKKLNSLIADGNLSGALEHISKMKSVSAFNRVIARAVNSMLKGMKSPPLLVLVNKLSNNDYGQYDPSHVGENKINIGKISIRTPHPDILLHEAIHAVTVQVLHTYFEGNRNSLTAAQKAGVEQLLKIMVLSKRYLGDNPAFASAYEDIYEFVSYALTDSEFKNALADMNLPGASKINYLVGVTAKEAMPKNLRDMLGQEGAEARQQFTDDYNEKKQEVANVDNMSTKPESAWTKFKLAIADLITAGYREVKAKVSRVKEEDRISLGEEEVSQENGAVPISLKSLLFQTNLGKSENQNFLMEIAAAFEDIMAPQTEAIALEDLSAKQKTPKPATKPRTADDYKLKSEVVPKSFVQYVRTLTTTQSGHLLLERTFQNKRAVLRKLSEQLARSNLIQYTGDKINDIYGQITTSVADAKNYFNAYVDEDLEALNSAVGKFARAAGIDTQAALETLHPYLEAIHEPERRLVKFLLKVPLIAAADTQRQRIIDIVDTQVLSQAQAQRLRKMLDDIVYTTDPTTGQRVLSNNIEKLGNKYDINSEEYNVTGLTSVEAANYRNSPVVKANQAAVDQIVAAMQRLGESTTELNKIGHYWSQPVNNRVAFYGWKHYIPLKGNPQHSAIDEMLDFDSKALGRELQDSSGAFGGRISVSKNPILQMSVDATRAAIRAGQRNLTLAIKNSLEKGKYNPNGQGLIIGTVVDTISFKDRTNEDLLRKYKGENHIFHYNDDGTIDILKVQDKALRESIRQTFKSSSPLIDKANQITGLIAQGHTRYNYNFAPMNFVRDALTNAFVMGADMGPAKAAQYIKAMAAIVVNGGMYKSMQVARLYQSGHASDIARLKQMAQKDTFVKHMYELIDSGGMVTHLSGLSLKSQFQELHKQIGAKGIMYKKEQFDKFVDTWTNMFELASRTSAYMVSKDNYYAENKERGMTDSQAMAEASARAVSFTKNLANFEQVGEWGKAMGALYMFFRPAATGAARSLQAITPAFTSLQSAVDALPPSVRSNPAALATYKKNYAAQKRNAQIMMGSLIALGFFAHTMSKMMAPDDDLGRNAVDADDMDRWTRYARFHIPDSLSVPMGLGKNVVFQMPWGMGLGAFCAAGAQLSAMYDGKTSITKGLANIFGSIAMDSFVPIPVSKMPITDQPLEFLLDSIAPSIARPVLELALNKNGLGQVIHNEQTRRFGDAYTGGDSIPQIYKDAARGIANETTGAFDWNPNTLYFLTNTYMDGPGRVIETLYGINDLSQGRKNFNPKTDIPLMGSFFGSKVNIDAQQFSSVENKIKRIEGIMKQFATDPEQEVQYMIKHPLHAAVVDYYNKELVPLNSLRKEANEYRLNKYLSPKDRTDLLKINTLQANLIKNQMIQVFKAYDITP